MKVEVAIKKLEEKRDAALSEAKNFMSTYEDSGNTDISAMNEAYLLLGKARDLTIGLEALNSLNDCRENVK